MFKKTFLAVGVAGLALGGGPAQADELSGNCVLHGELTFASPLGNTPAPLTYSDRLVGTCSGRLNGEPQHDAPVTLEGGGSGALGCLAVRTSGKLTLTFTRGTTDPLDDRSLRFFTETVGTLGQFANTLRGAVRGHAVSFGTLLRSLGGPTINACQNRTLATVRYDLLAVTLTPLVG